MAAYYNENDPFAAQWLRNLISRGLIAPGDVDERSIVDVRPMDLQGYEQCHFFAGIGGWSLALRLAGWHDDRPVWTGSCPCQPFSGAGARRGEDDPRHLWPQFRRLIGECAPPTVFGEQVSGPLGRAWLDSLFADLESDGYACGAADLCAAGVGAPHIRQRLYWMADAAGARCQRSVENAESKARDHARVQLLGQCGGTRRMADADGRNAGAERLQRCGQHRFFADCDATGHGRGGTFGGAQDGRMGDAGNAGLPDAEPPDLCRAGRQVEGRAASEPGGPFDPWRELEWIDCRDGKARPTQPGLFPLAARIPGDVGRLRGAGNAIVPPLAAQFVTAAREAIECR